MAGQTETKHARTSAYTADVGDGYEYGLVIQAKGKRDELVPKGKRPTFEEAERARVDLAKAQEGAR